MILFNSSKCKVLETESKWWMAKWQLESRDEAEII
jgi:hypothetical protein